jgi:hypothetical protein
VDLAEPRFRVTVEDTLVAFPDCGDGEVLGEDVGLAREVVVGVVGSGNGRGCCDDQPSPLHTPLEHEHRHSRAQSLTCLVETIVRTYFGHFD